MTDVKISIKEETMEELRKLQESYKMVSIEELLKKLIFEEKQKRLDEFSDEFKKRMDERNLTLDDIIESGQDIREEILKEKGISR